MRNCYAVGLAIAWSIAFDANAARGQAFTNATAAAGITHNSALPNCPTCGPTFAQEQSGGAAAGDFDGDGWVDLYVTRYFDSDVLYRNNRDGTFSDVTLTAFPGGVGNRQTNGAAWGDVDNDGDLDLAVATLNESRHLLYINDGLGRFAEEGATRGVHVTGEPLTSGTSVSMGDYDRDGYLDMYIAEWRGFTADSIPAQARLFRNLGAEAPGHFSDVTASAGVAMDVVSWPLAGKSLSFTPRFSDLDRDGHTDIAVASDSKTTRLSWNNGDGTFVNGTAAAGIATGTNDMGFTLADFNRDGWLDWFVTSIGRGTGVHPSGNRLFLNNGNRTFTDVTQAAGVREGGWGWGAEALDFDNDGDLDIAHTNGMGIAAPDRTMLLRHTGDFAAPQFVDASAESGITDAGQGRGLLTLDYDRDGDLDLFIVNFGEPPILYRNDGGNAGNWIAIKTVGSQSNRDGIGAYVTLTPDVNQPGVVYVAEIDGSSSYLSQSEMTAHFGLGDIATIDRIEIVWPSGYRQTLADVAVNQRITVAEGLFSDFNGDEQVTAADLAAWGGRFGDSSTADPAGDADRDGDVDGADLLMWQRQFGRTVGGAAASAQAAVPEASSAGVAMAGGVAALVGSLPRRRRQCGWSPH
ncbi:MAG: hypothetical protein DCC67_10850 [Planctomycetota bacterium]|nr:MAG: hypothetical protein DCC67_10850 [Planctomycetota bacterium]